MKAILSSLVLFIAAISPPLHSQPIPGDSIGFTTYDYATNGSALRNIVNFGDGDLAIGRTMALLPDAADRGTYYSISSDGGSSWTSLTRVELTRQGWGNITQIPAAGGAEIVVSHTGLSVCVDAARGAEAWTCGFTPGSTGLFPRVAISNPFFVHIVAAENNQATRVCYYRSTDYGTNWDDVNCEILVLPPGDLEDCYDLATYDSTVAWVIAPKGGDVRLGLSTDNGETWTEEIIHDHAGPGELPPGEKEFQSDGTIACIFDSEGNLHVVWCNFLAIGDANGDPQLYPLIDAPVRYWSERTGIADLIPTVHDRTILNLPPTFRNLAAQPDIAVDSLDNVYIMYQQRIAEQDTAGGYLQHIFAAGSRDGGYTWREFVDITPGEGFDASFGSMADLADSSIHIIYFSDPLAGNYERRQHEQVPVVVRYLRHPTSDLVTAVNDPDPGQPSSFALDQNYPNPFNPTTRLTFSVAHTTDVDLSVYDILGRRVATIVSERLGPGSYSREWDAGTFSSGVYFYKLKARITEGGHPGEFVATRKLLLLR